MPPKGPTDIIVVPGAICWRIIGRKRSGITTVYWLAGHKSNLQTNYTTNKLSRKKRRNRNSTCSNSHRIYQPGKQAYKHYVNAKVGGGGKLHKCRHSTLTSWVPPLATRTLVPLSLSKDSCQLANFCHSFVILSCP